MDVTITLNEVLKLALKLSPKDRLQLIERVASSVEQEIEVPAPELAKISEDEHWGRNLVRLINELGPIEMVHPEIEDATEWVKQIRREQEIQRSLDWGSEEE